MGTGLDALERRKRAQTIASIVRRALSALIWTTAVLMVLRELDVDITPVLTGAGIVGLAIGFGAQTLVRDVITGFFLIVEDQVRVGDVAMVNGTGGLVEQINLRTIVLRDVEGVVHVIPNGEIKTLANRTKDFSYYVIDLGVEYDEDTDRVVALVREAGAELMRPTRRSRRSSSSRWRSWASTISRSRVSAEVAHQNGAAEAMGGRPRAAAPHQAGAQPRGHPFAVTKARRHNHAQRAKGCRIGVARLRVTPGTRASGPRGEAAVPQRPLRSRFEARAAAAQRPWPPYERPQAASS